MFEAIKRLWSKGTAGKSRETGGAGNATLKANAEKALRMKQEAGPSAHIPPHQTSNEGAIHGTQVNRTETTVGKEPTYTPNLKRSHVARSGDAS